MIEPVLYWAKKNKFHFGRPYASLRLSEKSIPPGLASQWHPWSSLIVRCCSETARFLNHSVHPLRPLVLGYLSKLIAVCWASQDETSCRIVCISRPIRRLALFSGAYLLFFTLGPSGGQRLTQLIILATSESIRTRLGLILECTLGSVFYTGKLESLHSKTGAKAVMCSRHLLSQNTVSRY